MNSQMVPTIKKDEDVSNIVNQLFPENKALLKL
jgi:hypothetical protein